MALNCCRYLTEQSYYLLKGNLGKSIPKYEEYLALISNGAYDEDEVDLVFKYKDLVAFDNALISISHFWDADQGDFDKNYFDFALGMETISIGPYENAFTKMMLFAYGGWCYSFSKTPYLRVQIPNGDWLRLIDLTPNHISLGYYSLVDLYKTNRMYTTLVGSYEMYNETKSRYESYTGDIYVTDEFKNEIVWDFLGRMCHLLEDMSVPAHVHRDEHGLLDDRYETWVAANNNYKVWDYQNAGSYLNPYYYNSSNPLHSLMYLTQQTADHFGSTGPGDVALGNDDILGDHSSGEYNFLSGGYLTALGEPTGAVNITTPELELKNIRNKTLPLVLRATAGLLYWFASEADIIPLPSITISPTTNNVGTIKGTTEIHSSFTIQNTGNVTFSGNVKTTNYTYDLDYINTPTVYEDQIDFSLSEGQSITINYRGVVPAYYGPFTETLNITTSIGNRTHTIVGSIALPDFCYGETTALAASPEELLFDKAFVDFYVADTLQVGTKNIEKKSIKERLDFAYKLLKKDKTEKAENICQEIIELYPESEMGISFYAMGLLWEAAYSDIEAPDFTEKDFKKYLKKLTEKKDKFKINGYAQLILSLLDVGNDIEGLEKLFSDYEYDGLKELALFHQFVHYYIYKQDNETARKVSDQLDKMFIDSRYGYQTHLIFGDEGYSLEGLKELLKKKQESLLAKRGESKNDILSEMPKEYKLFNNYPNPFNPTTTIKYSVPKVSNVKLSVYNMMGQLIKTLVNETKAPGFYNVEWNGTNENNTQVSSGIYFYRFESDNFVANNKMILLK